MNKNEVQALYRRIKIRNRTTSSSTIITVGVIYITPLLFVITLIDGNSPSNNYLPGHDRIILNMHISRNDKVHLVRKVLYNPFEVLLGNLV